MISFRNLPLLFLSCLSVTIAIPTSSSHHPDPHSDAIVNKTTCNGKEYIYRQLAGYGSVPSDARDSYGDTLGGFGSSAAVDIKSWRKLKNGSYTGTLYALPDRGWNTEGTLNYQVRLHIFDILFTPNPHAIASSPAPPNLHISYKCTTLLTDPLSNPLTGLEPDPRGGLDVGAGFPLLPAATYAGNGFGEPGSGGQRASLDTEGLILNADGTYWISDEYGAYIYLFSRDGKMMYAIQPPQAFLPRRNGSISFSADSPPVYDPDRELIPADPESGRSNNQGLEGLTVSPDGKTLYVLTQSALIQDGGPDNPFRKRSRLLVYDVSTVNTKSNKNNNTKRNNSKHEHKHEHNRPALRHEYVVTLPLYDENQEVAAQSEIHYLSNTQFLILARDGAGRGQDDTKSLYRHIDIFDISSATDISAPEYNAVNGSIASKEGGLKPGIKAAEYCPFLDFNLDSELARFGLRNGGEEEDGEGEGEGRNLNEKWESISLLPVDGKRGTDGEFFVLSVSDNDFVTQNGYLNFGNYTYADGSGLDIDTQALVFRFKLPVPGKGKGKGKEGPLLG